ncbi:MAG: tetratricopeptide repeat protein [Xanthomonadales bacterium]
MTLSIVPDAAARDEADRLYEDAVRRHADSTPAERFAGYARAAEAGHPAAQYNVAMMYANGESVNVDYQQAVYWFRKSADQRFAPAQLRLGEMHYFGMGGLARDPRTAARLFESAAEQGDPDACLNLAILLGSGDAVSRGTEDARSMLQCAEEGGNEFAADYRAELDASPDGRFSAATQADFWRRQKQFWVDMAARFGVREAEEAVGGQTPDG